MENREKYETADPTLREQGKNGLNIHTLYSLFMWCFRPQRARDFTARFPVINDSRARVLDVGGGLYPWDILKPAAKVTILNVKPPAAIPEHFNCEFIVGDGRRLAYPDGAFDLVFSNSVIEHVGDRDSQKRFAGEMLRVGQRIYCQTPNRWFPVEPHLITILVHWLPFSLARRLVRYGSVWGLVTKPSQEVIDAFLRSIRLLTYRELTELFPGCNIRRERVLGLTKSFIVERSFAGTASATTRGGYR